MDGLIKRFTSFDKLIATSLIKFFYWIGIICIVLAVIGAIFAAFGNGFGSGLLGLIGAPIGGVLALVFWRFICEIYIVVFGMYDRLGTIEAALTKK
jgi:hypothetical protein